MVIHSITIRDPFTGCPKKYEVGGETDDGFVIERIYRHDAAEVPVYELATPIVGCCVVLSGALESTIIYNPDVISITYS